MLSDELLLLKIIDSDASLSLLLNRGYSNSQIANMIQAQEKLGNVEFGEKRIQLTELGKARLAERYKESKFRVKDSWILPQEHLYHKPISEDVIVLPDRL